ncbi:MAG: MarR family transcriptional regulator [Alphaproteobacteria bacterium]|nr:MarR family transcriptional regulator [Alphaproteobacteria bacterium]
MIDIKLLRSSPRAEKSLPDHKRPSHIASRYGFAEEDLRQAIELLFFAYRDMTAGPDEMLAGIGLGRAHHRAIHFIGRNPGITVADLLVILRISKQSLARVLKDVVERELVRQIRDEGDQRRRPLYLTEQGIALETDLSAVQQERLAKAFAVAGPAAVEGWRAMLETLADPADRARLAHAAERRTTFARGAGDVKVAVAARTKKRQQR